MGKIELFAVPAVQHKVRRDGDVMFIFGGGGWGGGLVHSRNVDKTNHRLANQLCLLHNNSAALAI